jgi:hypothetical protein
LQKSAQIFLSYPQQDRERASAIYKALSGAGFRPWMAEKDILPGETFRFAIERSIEESDFFSALPDDEIRRQEGLHSA